MYYGYIYRTDILDKKAYYIGQAACSSHGPFNPENPNYFGSGKKIKAYIKKHGTKNLRVSLLAIANNPGELNQLEAKFVGESYKEISHKICWNLRAGGTQPGVSEETRCLMSKARLGISPWNRGVSGYSTKNKGRVFSEETRRKMSESAKKRKSQPWSGKSLPLEVREKISKTLSGRKIPSEIVEKVAKANTGKERTKETCERISKGIRLHYLQVKV